jgi:hypothetical protein
MEWFGRGQCSSRPVHVFASRHLPITRTEPARVVPFRRPRDRILPRHRACRSRSRASPLRSARLAGESPTDRLREVAERRGSAASSRDRRVALRVCGSPAHALGSPPSALDRRLGVRSMSARVPQNAGGATAARGRRTDRRRAIARARDAERPCPLRPPLTRERRRLTLTSGGGRTRVRCRRGARG